VDVIFPDTGLLYLARQAVGTGLIYDLYMNDYTPGLDSNLGNFVRGNWSGYIPQFVPMAAWTVSLISAHVGSLSAAPIPFTNPSIGPVQVYGYFVKDASNTVLVAAARFDLAPITIPVGNVFTVVPLIGSFSGLAS
jgi:hypothetical protein